jgi:hypothetical protein
LREATWNFKWFIFSSLMVAAWYGMMYLWGWWWAVCTALSALSGLPVATVARAMSSDPSSALDETPFEITPPFSDSS